MIRERVSHGCYDKLNVIGDFLYTLIPNLDSIPWIVNELVSDLVHFRVKREICYPIIDVVRDRVKDERLK